MFLEGKQDQLVKELTLEMQKAAENLEFEKAAQIRDNIAAAKKIAEKQKIVSTKEADQDVIGFAESGEDICIRMFYIRAGHLIGSENFLINNSEVVNVDENEESNKETLSSFVKQYYGGDVYIPKEFLLQTSIEEQQIIEKWLGDMRGNKVNLIVPRRGEKLQLVEMAEKNAADSVNLMAEKHKNDVVKTQGAITELGQLLNMENIPTRIEAYDISHIQGVFNVGSMIVFENGRSKRKDYRRFKIKYQQGVNDYENMREVFGKKI